MIKNSGEILLPKFAPLLKSKFKNYDSIVVIFSLDFKNSIGFIGFRQVGVYLH